MCKVDDYLYVYMYMYSNIYPSLSSSFPFSFPLFVHGVLGICISLGSWHPYAQSETQAPEAARTLNTIPPYLTLGTPYLTLIP